MPHATDEVNTALNTWLRFIHDVVKFMARGFS